MPIWILLTCSIDEHALGTLRTNKVSLEVRRRSQLFDKQASLTHHTTSQSKCVMTPSALLKMFQEEPKTSKNSVFLIFLFLVCSESWIDGVCAALAVSVGGVMVMVKLQGNTVNGATLRSPL